MPSTLPALTVPFVPRLMLPGGMPLTATQLLLSLLLAALAVPEKMSSFQRRKSVSLFMLMQWAPSGAQLYGI